MYSNIELLTDESKNLRLAKEENFSFAKGITQVPIAINEFFDVVASYPVLFIKNTNASYSAMALLSLGGDKNLFINDLNQFDKSEYLPMFLKRYPFTYAENEKQLLLAYDNKPEYISETLELALFNEDGSQSELLLSKIKELNLYQNSMQEISQVIDILDKAAVLERANEPLIIGQNKINLNGFYYVNEEKLNDLKDKHIVKLVKSGAYKVAIAQLLSMNNLRKLIDKSK